MKNVVRLKENNMTISKLLKKRLDSRKEMERVWDEWNDTGRKGCPPPDPYIMDWDSLELSYQSQKRWEYGNNVIIISVMVIIILWVLLISSL